MTRTWPATLGAFTAPLSIRRSGPVLPFLVTTTAGGGGPPGNEGLAGVSRHPEITPSVSFSGRSFSAHLRAGGRSSHPPPPPCRKRAQVSSLGRALAASNPDCYITVAKSNLPVSTLPPPALRPQFLLRPVRLGPFPISHFPHQLQQPRLVLLRHRQPPNDPTHLLLHPFRLLTSDL